MSQWLVTQGDNQFSVDGLAQLKSMAEAGDLKPGDMIQPPGASDWIYATEVPQLAAIFDAKGGGDDFDDVPKRGGAGALIAGGLGLVALVFGAAAGYFAMNLPNGNEVLIGDGGLSYSQMIVTEPGQALRKDPEDRSQMTTSLKKDEILDLLSKRGDFYRARTQGGAEGWIVHTAVIPMYQLGGDDVREEYDPLYNPDRYVEVANASWQQLPSEKPRRGDDEEVMITAFSFNLWNSSKYTMTDVVLRATLKDAKGAELDTIEFEIEGEIPGGKGTMVGTLKPPEDEEDGDSRLLTAYTFSKMSEDDPELQLRYVDGVEVELGLEEFTNAQIDIVELRAVPDEKASKDVTGG